MTGAAILEEDLHEGWIYLLFDDNGNVTAMTRDEWEATVRPDPEDQG